MADIKKYFIDQLVDIAEIQQIIKALRPEFEILTNNVYKVLCNMFILDLDEDGCTRYEDMLGIKPYVYDTFEDRKIRILTLYKGDTPYTIIALRRKLESICGSENVDIVLDENNYYIWISLGLNSKSQYDSVCSMVEKMLPCNLDCKMSLMFERNGAIYIGSLNPQICRTIVFPVCNAVMTTELKGSMRTGGAVYRLKRTSLKEG